MERDHSPENTRTPKWMTQEDKELIEGIEDTLRSEDYFSEGLDHIQGLYYGATSDADRYIILQEAEDFIANNRQTEKPGTIERVEAYKAFIDKLKDQGGSK